MLKKISDLKERIGEIISRLVENKLETNHFKGKNGM